MKYSRAKRFIFELRKRGFSAQRIADELNFAGERQPRTKAPYDAKVVESLVMEMNKVRYD